jgi:hypothetical protein
MSPTSHQATYIMHEQARDTVRQIMREQRAVPLVTHPSWLAFGLLLVAFNIITITTP